MLLIVYFQWVIDMAHPACYYEGPVASDWHQCNGAGSSVILHAGLRLQHISHFHYVNTTKGQRSFKKAKSHILK